MGWLRLRLEGMGTNFSPHQCFEEMGESAGTVDFALTAGSMQTTKPSTGDPKSLSLCISD